MLKNTFLNKMKGATVTNNRSRIARHCSSFKSVHCEYSEHPGINEAFIIYR